MAKNLLIVGQSLLLQLQLQPPRRSRTCDDDNDDDYDDDNDDDNDDNNY